jgi:hypothetical protein
MIRSLLCSLVFFFLLPASNSAALAAPDNGPIQGMPGQPTQVGPWQVVIEHFSVSRAKDTPALDIQVKLRNTSSTSQSLADGGIFTCYRADVWQSLPSLESNMPLPAEVASGETVKGILSYQLPPDVLSFGLVFLWQTPDNTATGIWSLQLPPHTSH